MTTLPPVARSEVEQLHAEIRRYLNAVDAFRREGCRIRWLATRRAPTTARPGSSTHEEIAP